MRADFQQIGAAVAHADDVVVEEDSVVYWRACEHVEAELGRSLIVGSSLPSLQPVVLRHAGLVFIGIGQLIIRAEPFRPGIDRVNLAYVIHEIAALRDNCIACFTEGAVVVMNCDLHEVVGFIIPISLLHGGSVKIELKLLRWKARRLSCIWEGKGDRLLCLPRNVGDVTLARMPRANRGDEAGGVYHALNRGNGRQRVFHAPADYAAFLDLLADATKRLPAVRVLAACLMPNHVHLVLWPGEAGAMGPLHAVALHQPRPRLPPSPPRRRGRARLAGTLQVVPDRGRRAPVRGPALRRTQPGPRRPRRLGRRLALGQRGAPPAPGRGCGRRGCRPGPRRRASPRTGWTWSIAPRRRRNWRRSGEACVAAARSAPTPGVRARPRGWGCAPPSAPAAGPERVPTTRKSR